MSEPQQSEIPAVERTGFAVPLPRQVPEHPAAKGVEIGPWDVAVLVATLVVAVTTPLDVVFGRLGSLWVMALSGVISLLFAADIVRRFSRPIEIDGRPVADRAVIRHHYLRGWFTVDLLAAIPFGLLAMAPGIAGSVLAATLRLLGLTRILRVARILALQRDWRARTSLNPALLRLSFFVFWVLVPPRVTFW